MTNMRLRQSVSMNVQMEEVLNKVQYFMSSVICFISSKEKDK